MNRMWLPGVVLALVAWLPGPAAADPLPRFPAGSVWNQDVSGATLHPHSADMISHLDALGGWGDAFNIDFPFYVLHADGGSPTGTVVSHGGYVLPDCDPLGFAFPLPAGGGMSGTGPPFGGAAMPSYTCTGDCYLLVVSGNTLYESLFSNVSGSNLESYCALRWDLTKVYPHWGRGEQCVSTSGSGTPIAPLLFNADEMYTALQQQSGNLGHAIRIMLNDIKQGAYVHPASSSTIGNDNNLYAVPSGSRLRLRADFPVDTFVAGNFADGGAAANLAARVMLRTLQKYGMVLSDSGSVPLSAESDYYTTHKWSEFGMDPATEGGTILLKGVRVTDFQVVYTGEPIAYTVNCVRTPDDFLFIDGYDF